jgi:hypothetical protein
MREKYAKDGLVIVTVSVDPKYATRYKPAVDDTIRELLGKHKLTSVINLILDASEGVVEKQLRSDSTPSVYVFNREGKWRQLLPRDDEELDAFHKRVEDLVVKLLKAK